VNTWGRLWLKGDKASGFRIFALDSTCTVNRIKGPECYYLLKLAVVYVGGTTFPRAFRNSRAKRLSITTVIRSAVGGGGRVSDRELPLMRRVGA